MKTGIDVLAEKKLYISENIGLVTNQTGRLEKGVLTVDGLLNLGYKIQALFSPEHGLFGVEQEGIKTHDLSYKGIPAYSLYGDNRRPGDKQLKGLDLILFDMQDIGTRYYTYLYTLAYVLEEAASRSLPVVVTDRPAPLGRRVEGNPITADFNSFVGAYGLPNRTGMTMGEYALYLRDNYITEVDLTVIPMEGYDGGLWPHNRPWINPSPNIPSFNTALVYPGTCLFEGTDISEGRGTTRPFELIGAPGLDGRKLSDDMNSLNLAGTEFSYVQFKPAYSKHQGEICHGVQVHVTDRSEYDSLKTGLILMSRIFTLFPGVVCFLSALQEGTRPFLESLSGTATLSKMLLAGAGWKDVYGSLTGGEQSFIELRDKVMLYD